LARPSQRRAERGTRRSTFTRANVIRRAAQSTPTFVVLNNHFRGQAPANAFELHALLTGRRPEAPNVLRRAYPRLAESTRPGPVPEGQSDDLLGDGLSARERDEEREDK
jgi:hypothetical protein